MGQIYCYVTGEQCPTLRTADIGDEINGKLVEEHGDYEAWTRDERETNELVFFAMTGYLFRSARAVQKEMGWAVNWSPIHRQLKELVGDDVIAWADAGVDEADVCERNGFQVAEIAAELRYAYAQGQESSHA
jgi:hypothetical protein